MPDDIPVQPADDQPADGEHDAAGGDLARSIARAYRAAGTRPRRGGRGWVRTGSDPRRGTSPQLSGPGPDSRDPQRLDQLMSRLVAEHGWENEVAVHGVFGRWDSLVGVEVAQHCRPEQFVDGRLVVRADSTAWATQMRLLVPTVLQRLHDEIGQDTVTRIDVRGPQAPSWRHGRFTVRDGRGPRDTYG
ncbi:MAG: DciA family protein [Actinomycetota bacterium]|nr:DciA family protein [Actinomycetota bacterium]